MRRARSRDEIRRLLAAPICPPEPRHFWGPLGRTLLGTVRGLVLMVALAGVALGALVAVARLEGPRRDRVLGVTLLCGAAGYLLYWASVWLRLARTRDDFDFDE